MAGSTLGCVPRSSRIYITSLVGTLEYILAISSDANFVLWLMGMLSRSSIRCTPCSGTGTLSIILRFFPMVSVKRRCLNPGSRYN